MVHIYCRSRKVASFSQEPDGCLLFIPRHPKVGARRSFPNLESFRQFLDGFLSAQGFDQDKTDP